jgi:hypothetical protein
MSTEQTNNTVIQTQPNSSMAQPAAPVSQPPMAAPTTNPLDFSKKNPFGDFSQFEESIDKMEPIVPEVTAEELEKKI